jgi:hypothetical protein
MLFLFFIGEGILMHRLYRSILAAIFLFYPSLQALKKNHTCMVKNCVRNMEPLKSLEDFYNHALRVCHSCPWCQDWIKYDSFNELMSHMESFHQSVDRINVPFYREPNRKKRRNNGKINIIYTCTTCQFISVRSDGSFNHKCRGKNYWESVKGRAKRVKFSIEEDEFYQESDDEVDCEQALPPQAHTYFLRSRNFMQADHVQANELALVSDFLKTPTPSMFSDVLEIEIQSNSNFVSEKDELEIFLSGFFCSCCQTHFNSKCLFELHECVRYLGDWFS